MTDQERHQGFAMEIWNPARIRWNPYKKAGMAGG